MKNEDKIARTVLKMNVLAHFNRLRIERAVKLGLMNSSCLIKTDEPIFKFTEDEKIIGKRKKKDETR